MSQIYQHWVGNLSAVASPLTASSHAIDEWFPSQAPQRADLIESDEYQDDTEVFHKVLALTGKIGPFRVTLGEDTRRSDV